MRPGWQKPASASGGAAAARRRRQVALGIASLLTATWILYMSGFFVSAPQYVLVIDAGSSGTRMNAYIWRPPTSTGALPQLEAIPPDAAPNKVPRRALETRRAYKRVETEPGMDKFSSNLGKLGKVALAPLLEWARAVVPRSRWDSTPVFLLGTAGLRKLDDSDRERVLYEARNILSKSGFRFEPSWARVLGGEDEGVFAWVALNAVSGTLGTKNTIGALDLGGSSLQVTFALDGNDQDGDQLKNKPAVEVSLMGTHHSLFTHSHYHFGLDDAFERSVVILMEEEAAKNPPAQKNTNDNAAETNNSPDAVKSVSEGSHRRRRTVLEESNLDKDFDYSGMTKVFHPCLHQNYKEVYKRVPLEGKQPVPAQVLLLGRPDAQECSKLALKVVTAPTDCEAPPCALGAPQPRSANKFIALAGFYVVKHFFKLDSAAGVAAVRSAGDAFCPLPWEEVQARHPEELAVETYCFRTSYISALISQGLKLEEDQVEIGEGTAGWTLGAALVEGHRLAGLSASGGSSRKISSTLAGLLPNNLGQLSAWVLGGIVVVALVFAFKRSKEWIMRALRVRGWAQIRRRNSSGILSAAEFAGIPAQPMTDSPSYSGLFYRIFGQPGSGKAAAAGGGGNKKLTPMPPSFPVNGGGGIAAVGSARVGISRSATYSRRLSHLELGGGT